MTPEENRRRVRELRFGEQRDTKNGQRKSPPQKIHNSSEARWIAAMNRGGSGTRHSHKRRHSENLS